MFVKTQQTNVTGKNKQQCGALQKARQFNLCLGFYFFLLSGSFVLKVERFQFPLKVRVIRVVDCVIKFLEDKV